MRTSRVQREFLKLDYIMNSTCVNSFIRLMVGLVGLEPTTAPL